MSSIRIQSGKHEEVLVRTIMTCCVVQACRALSFEVASFASALRRLSPWRPLLPRIDGARLALLDALRLTLEKKGWSATWPVAIPGRVLLQSACPPKTRAEGAQFRFLGTTLPAHAALPLFSTGAQLFVPSTRHNTWAMVLTP